MSMYHPQLSVQYIWPNNSFFKFDWSCINHTNIAHVRRETMNLMYLQNPFVSFLLLLSPLPLDSLERKLSDQNLNSFLISLNATVHGRNLCGFRHRFRPVGFLGTNHFAIYKNEIYCFLFASWYHQGYL